MRLVQSIKCQFVLAIFLLSLSTQSFSADGDLDPEFIPDKFYAPSGMLFAAAEQVNDKIIVGGLFDWAGGHSTKGLARFNADGSIDSTFEAEVYGDVQTILTQQNGNIYVAGSLENEQSELISGILRLDSSGEIDQSFQPSGFSSVESIIELPDQKLLVTRGSGSIEGGPVRLNTDGSIDPSFIVGNWKPPVIVLSSGEIIATKHSDDELVKLNADGSQDQSWSVIADGRINTILETDDGSLLVGGEFSSIQGEPAAGLARLSGSGVADPSFSRAGTYPVLALAMLANGNILVGSGVPGEFPIITEGVFSELTPSGAYSIDFQDPDVPPFYGLYPYVSFSDRTSSAEAIYNIIPLTNGKIIIIGRFDSAGDQIRHKVALLDDVSTVNPSFNAGLFEAEGGTISDMAVTSNGKIVITGKFSRVGSQAAFNLARLNAEGSVDSEFNTARGEYTDSLFQAVAVQLDGKVLVGGQFSSIQGGSNSNLIRFHRDDGMIDESFTPNITSGRVEDIALDSQGNVIVGGSFGTIAGIARRNIARLVSNGFLDFGFDPNVNNTVNEILLEKRNGAETGRILIGGSFSTVAGFPHLRFAKLEQDGNVDSTFSPEFNNRVKLIAQSPVSEIDLIVGGEFFQVNGEAHSGLVGLDTVGELAPDLEQSVFSDVTAGIVQDDGEIIIAAVVRESGNRIFSVDKLSSLGSPEDRFKIPLNDRVGALLIQPDGNILVAGFFTQVNGESTGPIFRIENTVEVLEMGEEETCFPIVANADTVAVICM